jgi:hypothetical protein
VLRPYLTEYEFARHHMQLERHGAEPAVTIDNNLLQDFRSAAPIAGGRRGQTRGDLIASHPQLVWPLG